MDTHDLYPLMSAWKQNPCIAISHITVTALLTVLVIATLLSIVPLSDYDIPKGPE